MDNKILLFLIGLLLVSSCSKDNVQEFTTNDTANPFVKSKQVDWLKMDVQLRTLSEYVSRHKKRHPDDSLGLIEVIEDATEMMYFNLSLSVTKGEGKHIENFGVQSSFEQDQRLQYLAFSMQNDIYISQGEHIVPCELYHFERNYSISPHRTFIVGFPRKKLLKNEPVTFVLDAQYFQTAPLKIRYSTKDIFDSIQIEN